MQILYQNLGVTAYPYLRLASVGRLVFKLPRDILVHGHFSFAGNKEDLFIPTLMMSTDRGLLFILEKFVLILYYPYGVWPIWFHSTVNHLIHKVQRQVRRWIWKRREARRIATAFAFHNTLPTDLIHLLCP